MMRTTCISLVLAVPVVDGLQLTKDPKWDKSAIQDSGTYEGDFVKDDREIDPNLVNTVHVKSSVSSSSSSSDASNDYDKGTAPWFKAQCKEINEHCVVLRESRLREAKDDVKFFESDYMRQKRILDDMKNNHKDQKADIVTQKADVVESREEVSLADAVVESHAHCPPELEAAKAEYARLQAIPNKTPQDIDAECEAEKLVVEKEKCVDEYRQAQKMLAAEKAEHKGEKAELADEKDDVAPAAVPIPAQEKIVADALARWEVEKNKPLEGSVAAIDANCQAQRDDLLKHFDLDLDDLYAKYMKQKGILEGNIDTHQDEKADVAAQKEDVADAKLEKEEAEAVVAQNAHCPPELAAAKVDYARLKNQPNKIPEDVDAECKAEKVVMEKQKCVDILRQAQAVLAAKAVVHDGEKSQLDTESSEKAAAKAAIPPQEAKTAAAKAAWLAAKALREAAICKA